MSMSINPQIPATPVRRPEKKEMSTTVSVTFDRQQLAEFEVLMALTGLKLPKVVRYASYVGLRSARAPKSLTDMVYTRDELAQVFEDWLIANPANVPVSGGRHAGDTLIGVEAVTVDWDGVRDEALVFHGGCQLIFKTEDGLTKKTLACQYSAKLTTDYNLALTVTAKKCALVVEEALELAEDDEATEVESEIVQTALEEVENEAEAPKIVVDDHHAFLADQSQRVDDVIADERVPEDEVVGTSAVEDEITQTALEAVENETEVSEVHADVQDAFLAEHGRRVDEDEVIHVRLVDDKVVENGEDDE